MITTKAQKRLAFISLLLLAALLAVSAGCANAKVNANQAQLVRDIAKSGLIVGRPLPRGMKIESERTDSDADGLMDGQLGSCSNGVLSLDNKNGLTWLFATAPEDAYGDPKLSVVTVKTGDGQNIFGLPKATLLKLYGEPSEIKEVTAEDSSVKVGCKSYDYYFDMGNGDIAQYSFAIPYVKSEDCPPNKLNKVMGLTCVAIPEILKPELKQRKVKLFPWPKGI